MDVLELIKTEHRQVEKLFSEIENTDNAKKLQTLFDQLYKELTLHAEVEQLTIYPAMREYEETAELLEEAEEEHVEARVMLEEIKPLGPTSSEFKAKISQLKEAVQHHVQEEESEIFSAVRQCMSEEELKQLAQEFKQAKSKLQDDISVASH